MFELQIIGPKIVLFDFSFPVICLHAIMPLCVYDFRRNEVTRLKHTARDLYF